MRWKAALAMVILAGLVVGVLIYDARVSAPLDDLKARENKIFPAFKADQAEEIRLVRSDAAKGTVVLANREGSWRVEEPVACKANNFNVSGLTSAISDCEPEKNVDVVRPAEGGKLDLARYGLDKPGAEVSVKMKGGSGGDVRFLLGSKVAMTDGCHYLKPAGEEAVYIVGKRLSEELLRGADEFRDRHLLDVASADVDSLELDVGKGPVRARRESGDKWRLTAPVSDRGNRVKIEALRDKLLSQELDEFDHEAVDDAKQGFDQPAMRLALGFVKDGKPRRQEVLVGSKPVEGYPHLVYARRTDLPFLYRVKKKDLEDLQPTVNDLRDGYLETFSADRLVALSARGAAGLDLALEREGDAWRMTSPESASADKLTVEDVGSKLSALEIKGYLADAPADLAPFGLDKPELVLSLKLKGEAPVEQIEADDAGKKDGGDKDKDKADGKKPPEPVVLGELLFGKVCPPGAVAGADSGALFRYAKRAADPGIFAVKAEAVDKLLEGALAFRDRTMLKIADREKVSRLAVVRGELKYAAEKKDGKWMLTSPVGEEADSGSASRLVERMADLSAEKAVAEVPTEAKARNRLLAGYGLDKPTASVEVVVETGADPKVDRLLLGKASAAGGTYAMLAGGDLVCELSRQSVDDLGGELVRRELLDFDKAKVQKIVVTRKRSELVLARTGQGWNIEKPEPAGKADGAAVDGVLGLLAGLRAERIADYAPSSLGRYDLDKPVTTVTLEVEGGRPFVLLLGEGLDSGARRYVKVPDRAPVFVVGKAVAEKLEAPADGLRAREEKQPEKTGPAAEPPQKKENPVSAAKSAGGPLPRVKIKTDRGDIVVELFEDDAPNTVANFVELTGKKFYNGLVFHRVIKDFMIQGGCPQGTGTGDPGYRFADECQGNPHKVVKYALCMANAGPNTNGSQFFIVTAKACPWLDGKHTVFGKVVEGQAVVDAIGNTQTGAGDRPVKPEKMISIEVLSKRDHPYEVKKL